MEYDESDYGDPEDNRESAYERMLERADYLRDEMKDRKMEELWAAKHGPTWEDRMQQAREDAEDKLNGIL